MLESIVQRFLYHPTVLPVSAPLPPWARGGKEIWVKVEEGNRVHGIHFEAPRGRPTILFLHGNAQSVFEWALVSEDLAPLEAGLLLVDYPGYGKSSGAPSEAGLNDAGRAAASWLIGEAAVPESSIVIFGKSLGGGVATQLALERPGVMGLVLESAFRSIPAVAERLLPMLPTDPLLSSERYDSAERMPRIEVPTLVIHGTEDDLIPVEEGQALHDLAGGPKSLYLVEGAGHSDVSSTAGPAYGEGIRGWLDGLGGRRQP